jgi:transposase
LVPIDYSGDAYQALHWGASLAGKYGAKLVSLSFVCDLSTRHRATDTVAPKPHGGGYPARLQPAGLEVVRGLVQAEPNATLKELCTRLHTATQVTVSRPTMRRLLRKLNLPRKKTFRAVEQERPDIQQQRLDFLHILQQVAAEDLLFLDEAGSHQAMVRAYARALRGQRAHATKPVNQGRHVTILGALGRHGVMAATTVEGFTDSDVFLAFRREVLVPQLRPGQVIIMDNPKTHKVAGVAEAITTPGARRRHLPPYSPDSSPMEACWSKVKVRLRAQAARTLETREQAIAEAIAAITATDARGWFTHAGYRSPFN